MYSLDINFLNDRPEYKTDGARRGGRKTQTFVSGDRRPLYWGLAAGIFFPVALLALWGFLQVRNGDLERQQAELDSQLGNLEIQKKDLALINAQIKQGTDETQALATVFNQIKPWSAMAQDIRDRLPPNVQIAGITQIAPLAASAAAPASPAVAGQAPRPVSGLVSIDGVANSFNDVNDFLLTLQQSNFLQSAQTKLVSAELTEAQSLQSLDIAGSKSGGSGATYETPKLPPRVKFTLQTALSEVPASELIRELDRKGAVGLVTRIEALKEKGVIKP